MSERPELDKCQCSFAIRMVGDGCQYCNPEYMERFEEDEEDEG